MRGCLKEWLEIWGNQIHWFIALIPGQRVCGRVLCSWYVRQLQSRQNDSHASMCKERCDVGRHLHTSRTSKSVTCFCMLQYVTNIVDYLDEWCSPKPQNPTFILIRCAFLPNAIKRLHLSFSVLCIRNRICDVFTSNCIRKRYIRLLSSRKYTSYLRSIQTRTWMMLRIHAQFPTGLLALRLRLSIAHLKIFESRKDVWRYILLCTWFGKPITLVNVQFACAINCFALGWRNEVAYQLRAHMRLYCYIKRYSISGYECPPAKIIPRVSPLQVLKITDSNGHLRVVDYFQTFQAIGHARSPHFMSENMLELSNCDRALDVAGSNTWRNITIRSLLGGFKARQCWSYPSTPAWYQSIHHKICRKDC